MSDQYCQHFPFPQQNDQFVVLDLQRVMNDDALWTSRPIIVDVNTPDDINQQFDSISYNKVSTNDRHFQSPL